MKCPHCHYEAERHLFITHMIGRSKCPDCGWTFTDADDDEHERWVSERCDAVQAHIDTIPTDHLRDYLKELARYIVMACGEANATHWPPELHLADVVEKHLMRAVVIPDDDAPPPA